MSLIYHAPMLGNIHNQGILNIQSLDKHWTSDESGKIGKCIKTVSTSQIDTSIPASEWNINENSISMCGWFKFPFSEIKEKIESYAYNSTRTMTQGNLLGYNSYGGIALAYNSNNMYNDGEFSNLSVYASIRRGNSLRRNAGYSIPFDKWIHLCAVFDRDEKTSFTYVNGELYSQSSIDFNFTDISATHNFYINVHGVDGGNGPGMNIPIYINDVRLYNHALSANEVKNIARGLVVHYPLNDRMVEPTQNIITGLRVGGRTVIVDNNKIQNTGENIDTYFYIKTPPMLAGETYTISCYCSGLDTDNDDCKFGVGAQATTNAKHCGIIDIHNGYNELTFECPSELNDAKEVILDDIAGTWRTNIITLSNIQLELKDHRTGYTSFNTTRNNIIGIYDISGFSNNGTVNGNLSISNATPRYKSVTYFPAATTISHKRCVDNIDQEWTCCAWVKLDNVSSTKYLNNYNYGNRIVHVTVPLLYLNQGDNDYYMYGDTAVNANEWTHIAFVFQNSTDLRNVYINGALTNHYGPNKTSTPLGIPDTVIIGQGFDGYMSDYREYTTALSADDIAELYEMGVNES